MIENLEYLLDFIEIITPSLTVLMDKFNNIRKIKIFYNKHIKIFKLVLLYFILIRVAIKLLIYKIEEETVNLKFKLIFCIINIILMFYSLIKENKKSNT